MGNSAKVDVAALSGSAVSFSAYLKDAGQAFLISDETNGQQAHVRFTGPYQGREVVWDCCFVTVAHESQQSGRRSPELNQSFIDIGQPIACGSPLRVCLNLKRIDLPAILKMIVMIRNYKGLREGRHEFGEQDINPGP